MRPERHIYFRQVRDLGRPEPVSPLDFGEVSCVGGVDPGDEVIGHMTWQIPALARFRTITISISILLDSMVSMRNSLQWQEFSHESTDSEGPCSMSIDPLTPFFR